LGRLVNVGPDLAWLTKTNLWLRISNVIARGNKAETFLFGEETALPSFGLMCS